MRRDTDVRILLTGASSFTGFWFASELARMGHDVTATFRGQPDTYGDVRGARVQQLMEQVNPVWGTSFGSELFLDLVGAAQFDLFCHHAAETANYRRWDFDTLAASASNTRRRRDDCAAFRPWISNHRFAQRRQPLRPRDCQHDHHRRDRAAPRRHRAPARATEK